MLHEKVVTIIRKARATREPPPVMRELWAWQHEKITAEEPKLCD